MGVGVATLVRGAIDHIIAPIQSTGMLVIGKVRGSADGRRLIAAWTAMATTAWPSDANLQTTTRRIWPVAPMTRITVRSAFMLDSNISRRLFVNQ
jgi:hypothetical protein